MQGWVKLHRALLDWEWYDDVHMVRLFLHLLLKANHKENQWRGTTIPAGSFITGRKVLADETGLSERQIRTCLSRLKSTGEIAIKTTNKYSHVTLTNWASYQLEDDKTTSKTTSQTPTRDQQSTTTEECKNVKKDILRKCFDDFWSAGMAKKDKKQAEAAFNRIASKQADPEQFTITLINDIKSRVAGAQFGFDKLSPLRYLKNERWNDELPSVANDNNSQQDILYI